MQNIDNKDYDLYIYTIKLRLTMNFTPSSVEHHYTYEQNESVLSFEMIRHGETYYNIMPGGALGQGATDDELAQLTEKGKNQALKAGEFIVKSIENHEIPIYTKIVSSDLGRAHETALIIQQVFSSKLNVLIPVEIDTRLRARNWGIYEKTPVFQTYPELEDMGGVNYSEKYPDWKPEGGGESKNEIIIRVFEAIKERMEDNNKNEHTLYVVHNENIRALMVGYQSIPNCGWVGFKFNLDSIENPIEHTWTKDTQK